MIELDLEVSCSNAVVLAVARQAACGRRGNVLGAARKDMMSRMSRCVTSERGSRDWALNSLSLPKLVIDWLLAGAFGVSKY